MASYNVRRSTTTATDSYDPKQRFVGGVVLLLIILLIYSILKLVLGLSSTSSGNFGLNTPLGEEISAVEAAETTTTTTTTTTPTTTTNDPNTRRTRRPSNRILLPQSFVFLDLSGNPLQKDTYQTVIVNGTPASSNINVSTPDQYANVEEGKTWFVQVASFREEDRAQKLAQQIKDKEIVAEVNIVKSQNDKGEWWFMVRLPPQADRKVADQQKKQIDTALKLKAAVKKLE